MSEEGEWTSYSESDLDIDFEDGEEDKRPIEGDELFISNEVVHILGHVNSKLACILEQGKKVVSAYVTQEDDNFQLISEQDFNSE